MNEVCFDIFEIVKNDANPFELSSWTSTITFSSYLHISQQFVITWKCNLYSQIIDKSHRVNNNFKRVEFEQSISFECWSIFLFRTTVDNDSFTNSFTFGKSRSRKICLLFFLMRSSLRFVQILINTVYCCLALTAKSIQNWIFGELRSLELQRLKDKFWNYAFYKFCFLFGVLGLENLNELVLWISWFSVLAFALLFCQLAKERFELVSWKLIFFSISFHRFVMRNEVNASFLFPSIKSTSLQLSVVSSRRFCSTFQSRSWSILRKNQV